MPSTQSKSARHVAALLRLAMAYVLLVPALKRAMSFREDYLPFFCAVSLVFAAIGVISLLRRESIWRGDVDTLLAVVAAFYALTVLWAQSRWQAIDGALKYAVYLMAFLTARYVGRSSMGARFIRGLLIAGGGIAVSVGYLAAAQLIDWPGAVRGGAILGTFQYENALAAYAMFASFFLFQAWYETEARSLRGGAAGLALSLTGVLLVGAIILSGSRATWLIYAVSLLAYLLALPSSARSGTVQRMLVVLGAAAAVGTPLDAAIRKGDFHAVRGVVLTGFLLAAALELTRWASTRLIRGHRDTAWMLAGLTTFLRMSLPSVGTGSGGLASIVPAPIASGLKTISLTDSSLLARFFMTKDALKIALDHPFGTGAGGWNALYHRYQMTPYWFTEPHNHFAQVLVEIGFPGLLAYLAFWAVVVYLLGKTYVRLRALARDGAPGSSAVALSRVVSATAGVLALVAHSAVDYDLSFPAISLGLYCAVGVLLAEMDPPDAGPTPFRRILPGAVAVAILATSVFCVAGSRYRATLLAGKGVRSLAAGDVSGGRRSLLAAMGCDRWDPRYPLDVAESYAAEYSASPSEEVQTAAKLYLGLSRSRDPMNVDRQAAEVQALFDAGLIDDSVPAARDLVAMMPLSMQSHEALARVARAAMETHLSEVCRTDPRQPSIKEHIDALALYAGWVMEDASALAQRQGQVDGLHLLTYNPKRLDPSPGMSLAIGQSAFLRGDAGTALVYLSRAAGDKALSKEAGTWLSSLSTATGAAVPLPAGFTPEAGEPERLATVFGIVR